MFYGGFNTGTFVVQGLFNMTTIEGIENLNTAHVTTMMSMFAECEKLTTLDLHSFNTTNVTDMSYMFSNCKALTTIYCNDDLSASDKLTQSEGMFSVCKALVGGKGTAYDEEVVDKTYARPDGGTESPGYFTEKSYIPGDADGDTKVDVNDVTSTINYILNKPVAKFIKEAADMDKDGKIDVNDVQAIIYKALGK